MASQLKLQQTLLSVGVSAWGGPTQGPNINKADQKLCDACRVGDYDSAKAALDEGANPSTHIRLALGEMTPIFLCATKGYKNIAEALILCGAQIHKKMDFDGTVCLHHAASNDESEMCEFLIAKGCDVNSRDKLGRTPLMDAAEIGSIKVIQVLIANDAEVNALDNEKHSALSYCIDFISKNDPKFFDCAKAFVQEHNADPTKAGKFTNCTLLHFAAAQGDMELCRSLVEEHGANIMQFDNERKGAIEYAMHGNHEEVAKYLEEQWELQNKSCCLMM